MYYFVLLLCVFCICVPVLPQYHPHQPGRDHQLEAGPPQDGQPVDTDDQTLSPSAPGSENRQVPEYSFDKKILYSGNGDKKVFVKFVQGPFTYKKRREKAGRVTFTCNGCQRFNKYVPVVAWRQKNDEDPENDEYIFLMLILCLR